MLIKMLITAALLTCIQPITSHKKDFVAATLIQIVFLRSPRCVIWFQHSTTDAVMNISRMWLSI